MRRGIEFWALVAVASAGVAAAFQAPAPAAGSANFRDRAGNMTLSGFSAFQTSTDAEGNLVFQGEGAPLKGTWSRQGLEGTGTKLEGRAARLGNLYNLRDAVLSGSATLRVDRGAAEAALAREESRPAREDRRGTLRMNSERFEIVAEGEKTRVGVPGALVAFGQGYGSRTEQGQKLSVRNDLEMRGTRAVFTVDGTAGAAGTPIGSGKVFGPVTLVLTQTDLNVSAKTTRVTATGNELILDFTGERPFARLEGNVKIDGDAPAFSGVAEAARATLFLDSNLNVTGAAIEGSPVRTVVRPDGGRR